METETDGLGLAPASASDYRKLARRRRPRNLFDYLDGAAFSQYTADENLQAFRRLRLRQRVMRDVSQLNPRTQVLGQDLALAARCRHSRQTADVWQSDHRRARCAQPAGVQSLGGWPVRSAHHLG